MIKQSVALLTTALVLTGCMPKLLPEPTPAASVYRLSDAGTAVPSNANAVIIRIDRPTVPTSLQSDNIMMINPEGSLAKASGAKWAEGVPALVQNSLFDHLETRAALTGILPASGARTSHRLHLTVQNFEAEFDQGAGLPPLVRVQYVATLAHAGNRDLIGTRNVNQTYRSDAVRVSSIVDALDKANDAAMSEVMDWVEGQLSTSR